MQISANYSVSNYYNKEPLKTNKSYKHKNNEGDEDSLTTCGTTDLIYPNSEFLQAAYACNKPNFKAKNFKLQLTENQVNKFTRTASYGSIIALAMLLLNKTDKDGSEAIKELKTKMQDPEFIYRNKNYGYQLAKNNDYHAGIFQDDFDFGQKQQYSQDVLYPSQLSERIADASLKLVQIPEFVKVYDRCSESKNFEVTPENIEVIEKILNNEDLLNYKNMRESLAYILFYINRPGMSDAVKTTNNIIDNYLQNPKNFNVDIVRCIMQSLMGFNK